METTTSEKECQAEARRLKLPRTLATARASRAGTLRFRVSRRVKRVDATLTVTGYTLEK